MRQYRIISAIIITIFALTFVSYAQVVKLNGDKTEIRLLEQSRGGLTIEIDIGEINFVPVSTSGGPFVIPVISGFGNSNGDGYPDLPVARRLIAVPSGCELQIGVVQSEIEEISLEDLGIEVPIIPAQPPVSKSMDAEDIPFVFNREIYATDAYYSQPLTQAEILGILRNIRLGRITISPVEYNPVTRKLKLYTSLVLQIDFINPDWPETERTFKRFYSPLFKPLHNLIMNHALFSDNIMSRDTVDLVKYPVTYLIISDIMFRPQLQPFIEWKTQKGFNVITAYTQDIGYNTNDIKAYIDSIYLAETPAPSFVLFVGDVEQIPAFEGNYGSHITDVWYFENTGDMFPEMYYGRFSAQNAPELQPQIDKTIEYEKYAMPDPAYLSEATLVAGVDHMFAETHGNGQINYEVTHYFNEQHGIFPYVWLYPESGNPSAADSIIQTVSDGIGIYSYTGHCNHEGPNNPPFKNDDVTTLANYHQYTLGIGNCCNSNTFGDPETPCFGEAFLQSVEKGGIGYIGASNHTLWNQDYYWAVGAGPIIASGPTYEQTSMGAFDGLFHDHGEPVSRHFVTNAAVVFAGNLGVTTSGSRADYYWEIYHLMGDPSVMTYLGEPAGNNIICPESLLMTDTGILIEADPGSYAGISMNNILYGAGYIDSTGSVEIPLEPFAMPGFADIVVTAQNRIPYIDSIYVRASDGPHVAYNNHAIIDSIGNNDGLINCGERISIDIELINAGSETAYNIDILLRTDDSLATLIDSTDFCDSITGNFTTFTLAEAFTADISGQAPDGHTISFELVLSGSDTRDTIWISHFEIMVHAPSISVFAHAFEDIIGNNDGYLDPGESADMFVSLQNAGSGEAYNVSVSVSSNDLYITIIDAEGYFGDIYSCGGIAENYSDVFMLSVDETCPWGHSVPLTLMINGDYSFTAETGHNITIGSKSVFYRDDFSFNMGWSGLGGPGEWTIGPAAGGEGIDAYGPPDPDEDHTMSYINGVLGNDLTIVDGDYGESMNETHWVTSPPIVCSGFTGISLSYYRWLGIEGNANDHVFVQVYDGLSWTTIFENEAAAILESNWVLMLHDISEFADGNPSFQIRFGIGPTNDNANFCGWNIDDLELSGFGDISLWAPQASCSPDTLAYSLTSGDSTMDTVTIKNYGQTDLRFRLYSSIDWLTHDTTPHNLPYGDSIQILLTINTGNLPYGDHSDRIIIISNDPSLPEPEIHTFLTVFPQFVCGDADHNQTVNILDITYLISYLYNSGPPPNPYVAGDTDASGTINILDITRLIDYLYNDGSPPVCM